MARLVLFGDSIGRGVVYDEASDKYVLLQDGFANLLAREGGHSISNFAQFGSTIERGATIVKRQLDKLSSCDAVLLEFGGNDCDFDWAKIALEPQATHIAKTPPDAFFEKYTELIAQIRRAGGLPVLMNLPPIDPIRYFKRVSRVPSGRQILAWLGDKARIYRWQEMYSVCVHKIARLSAVPLIDIRTPFLEQRECPGLIGDDGIHPVSGGHRLIFNSINAFLQSFLPVCAAL